MTKVQKVMETNTKKPTRLVQVWESVVFKLGSMSLVGVS